jgi:hypothetical protein
MPPVDTVRVVRHTRLVTRALLVCLLAAAGALVAAPAALARNRAHIDLLAYSVTGASMSEDLTFQGDGGPACANAGVCGVNGHVHYGFDDIEHGDSALLIIRAGHHSLVTGFGFLAANGLTSATVTASDGPKCNDKIVHTSDGFDIEGNPGRVRFVFHSPFNLTDFVDSYCMGPNNADLWHVHALPKFSVPTSRLRHKRVSLTMSSSRTFHSGPFTGKLDFSAQVNLRRVAPGGSLNTLLQGGF